MHSVYHTGIFLIAATGMFILATANVLRVAPFSHHMILHIAGMNLLAPAAALALGALMRRVFGYYGAQTLVVYSVLQLMLFWSWHSPPLVTLAMDSLVVALSMQLTLLLAAFGFWIAIFSQPIKAIWRSVFALLITGKLFCLMAALLIFAPRALYPMTAPHGAVALADQQLAGLIMAVVCPLAYVATAIVLTVRWLFNLPAEAAPISTQHPAA